jgi:hypothetical protein
MKRPTILLALFVPFAIGACTLVATRSPRSSQTHSEDERAIRTARGEQNAAMETGNADLAATWWTEDITIRRALGQDVHGRTAYRQILIPTGNRDSSLVYQRDPESIEVSAHFPQCREGSPFEHGVIRS